MSYFIYTDLIVIV